MAKPGRVYWKGTLRLSLVTIAVEIYPAVETASEISFNQIHKPSGKRVRYERTVPGIGKVENADIVKGYEVEPEVYVLLEPDEIEAIRLESKRTIDLVQCVDRSEIDPRYFERPYYVLPADDQAAEGYAIIREALRESGKVAIGQVTMAGREHLVVVGPVGKGLVLNIIRYGDELRPAATYFDEIPEHKLEPDMMDMAVQLINRKSAPFNPDAFKDSYGVALRELVEEKAKGHKILSPPTSEPASNVINLKDALKRSVQEERVEPPKSGKPAAKKPSVRKPAGGSKGRAKA
jgi:DNA end-binding protein Ku